MAAPTPIVPPISLKVSQQVSFRSGTDGLDIEGSVDPRVAAALTTGRNQWLKDNGAKLFRFQQEAQSKLEPCKSNKPPDVPRYFRTWLGRRGRQALATPPLRWTWHVATTNGHG